jgi:predicted ATPase
MISRVLVHGFKSLTDVEVELGSVNVLIGANGSGKSNFLEAIGVIGASAFGSVEFETLRYRGVRPASPWIFKSSFKDERFRRLITLEAVAEKASYRIGLDNPIKSPSVKWKITTESLLNDGREILTRNPRGVKIYSTSGQPEKIETPADQTAAKLALARREDARDAHALIQDLEAYAIYSPTTNSLRGLTLDEVSRDPVGITGGGVAKAVSEILNRQTGGLGPFDVEQLWEMIEWADHMRVDTLGGTEGASGSAAQSVKLLFRDKFMRHERNAVTAPDASEGALYVLFLLVLVAHERAPRVFAIDNFDHALHPHLAASLTKAVASQILADGGKQMIATTQNPLVLDGLDLSNDKIRLFAVERNDKGHTNVSRITLSPELSQQGKPEYSLSRLWLMGRLGGVPRSL